MQNNELDTIVLGIVKKHGQIEFKELMKEKTLEGINQKFINSAGNRLLAQGLIEIENNFYKIVQRGIDYQDALCETIADEIQSELDQRFLTRISIENAELQKELTPLMIQANQSTIITNENTRNSNKKLIIIFLVTAFIASLSFSVSVVTLYRDSRIEKLTRKIEEQQLQLQSKDKVIQELLNKSGH